MIPGSELVRRANSYVELTHMWKKKNGEVICRANSHAEAKSHVEANSYAVEDEDGKVKSGDLIRKS